MKLATIICEFNPLHTGHKRLIDYAKTIADKVVCIMSGNFTQRAMPACSDKYSRARHAVLAGADLVVELPTVFATASAENFAYGGVTIANMLGADYLVFGSECGDVDQLTKCVDALQDAETNRRINAEVQRGVSYPRAVALATGLELLSHPNNVLAIEYLKALRTTHSTITPVTLQREDNYNDDEPQQYASSQALRADKQLRARYTFDFVSQDIDDTVEQKYCQLVPAFLAVATSEQLERIEGVSEGLHNRIMSADKTRGYEHLLEAIKTKRYTRLRLQRVILNQILSITKDVVAEYKSKQPCIKVLAVKSSAVELLQGIANETDEITLRADRLYATLSGKTAPTKLLKIDN